MFDVDTSDSPLPKECVFGHCIVINGEQMTYRYTIQRRYKDDLHYQIGLADTLDKANRFCDNYRIEHPEAGELRIYDYEEKKWIFPSFLAQVQVDKNWNPIY